MATQEVVALAIVAATAGIFTWKVLRPRSLFGRKSSGCGCPGSSSTPPKERMIFTARKGQTPQILIKPK